MRPISAVLKSTIHYKDLDGIPRYLHEGEKIDITWMRKGSLYVKDDGRRGTLKRDVYIGSYRDMVGKYQYFDIDKTEFKTID
jgi:hypothetical protein